MNLTVTTMNKQIAQKTWGLKLIFVAVTFTHAVAIWMGVVNHFHNYDLRSIIIIIIIGFSTVGQENMIYCCIAMLRRISATALRYTASCCSVFVPYFRLRWVPFRIHKAIVQAQACSLQKLGRLR